MRYLIYRIKMTMRNPSAIFWATVFPILLGALFYFMFGNIGNVEQFSEVAVGIVEIEKNDIFVDMMKDVEMENGIHMFEVSEYENVEDAEQALEEETIYGYIVLEGEEFSLTVRESDIYSSLIKIFLDQYKQNTSLIETVAKEHPERLAALATTLFEESDVEIKGIDLKGQDKSPYTQYFYALLAMSCLIASMLGIGNGINIQADLSALAARRNVAPTPKMQQIVADFVTTWLIYNVLTVFVLCVLIFVYKQDFGSNTFLILLGTWAGNFTGLSAGTMIGVVTKGDRVKKEGLGATFFMVSSFLGGLQWGNITQLLERHCPIVNRINPATLIVNSFKSLAVFGDVQQYWMNIGTLLGIGVLFLAISIFKLRRMKYANV